jgi:hypothetical protein
VAAASGHECPESGRAVAALNHRSAEEPARDGLPCSQADGQRASNSEKNDPQHFDPHAVEESRDSAHRQP